MARSRTPRRASALRLERLEERTLLSFAPPVNYPVWINPSGMGSEDFNFDGYRDLAVVNANLLPGVGGGRVAIMLNNGDGTFAELGQYEVGKTPSIVAVADFDYDGYWDLATANSNRNAIGPIGIGSVSVLFGDGVGWGRRFADIEVGWDTSCVAVGDFNLDGWSDLVMTNVDTRAGEVGTARMLLNNGDGTFAAPVTILTGAGPDRLGPGFVVVNDFNFDGIHDLAISSGRGTEGNGTVSILMGNGDGTFAEPVHNAVNNRPFTLRAGDFNGDFIPDLVTSHGRLLDVGDPRVSILFGLGDGTFAEFATHGIGTNPLGVITGDFNMDGLDDIAVSNPPTSLFGSSEIIHVGLSNGDGTFRNLPEITTGAAPLGLWVDDFDGLNGLDLAVTNAYPNIGGKPGSLSILLNDGDWEGRHPGGGQGGDFGAGRAYLTLLPGEPVRRAADTPVGRTQAPQTTPIQGTAEFRLDGAGLVVVAGDDEGHVSLDALFATDWALALFGE